jgi:hypothetical protein
MASNVLVFPAQITCQSCNKACSEDEMSTCPDCGDTFCGSAKSNCKSLCACDRLAMELADRAANLKLGFWALLWRKFAA